MLPGPVGVGHRIHIGKPLRDDDSVLERPAAKGHLGDADAVGLAHTMQQAVQRHVRPVDRVVVGHAAGRLQVLGQGAPRQSADVLNEVPVLIRHVRDISRLDTPVKVHLGPAHEIAYALSTAVAGGPGVEQTVAGRVVDGDVASTGKRDGTHVVVNVRIERGTRLVGHGTVNGHAVRVGHQVAVQAHALRVRLYDGRPELRGHAVLNGTLVEILGVTDVVQMPEHVVDARRIARDGLTAERIRTDTVADGIGHRLLVSGQHHPGLVRGVLAEPVRPDGRRITRRMVIRAVEHHAVLVGLQDAADVPGHAARMNPVRLGTVLVTARVAEQGLGHSMPVLVTRTVLLVETADEDLFHVIPHDPVLIDFDVAGPHNAAVGFQRGPDNAVHPIQERGLGLGDTVHGPGLQLVEHVQALPHRIRREVVAAKLRRVERVVRNLRGAAPRRHRVLYVRTQGHDDVVDIAVQGIGRSHEPRHIRRIEPLVLDSGPFERTEVIINRIRKMAPDHLDAAGRDDVGMLVVEIHVVSHTVERNIPAATLAVSRDLVRGVPQKVAVVPVHRMPGTNQRLLRPCQDVPVLPLYERDVRVHGEHGHDARIAGLTRLAERVEQILQVDCGLEVRHSRIDAGLQPGPRGGAVRLVRGLGTTPVRGHVIDAKGVILAGIRPERAHVRVKMVAAMRGRIQNVPGVDAGHRRGAAGQPLVWTERLHGLSKAVFHECHALLRTRVEMGHVFRVAVFGHRGIGNFISVLHGHAERKAVRQLSVIRPPVGLQEHHPAVLVHSDAGHAGIAGINKTKLHLVAEVQNDLSVVRIRTHRKRDALFTQRPQNRLRAFEHNMPAAYARTVRAAAHSRDSRRPGRLVFVAANARARHLPSGVDPASVANEHVLPHVPVGAGKLHRPYDGLVVRRAQIRPEPRETGTVGPRDSDVVRHGLAVRIIGPGVVKAAEQPRTVRVQLDGQGHVRVSLHVRPAHVKTVRPGVHERVAEAHVRRKRGNGNDAVGIHVLELLIEIREPVVDRLAEPSALAAVAHVVFLAPCRQQLVDAFHGRVRGRQGPHHVPRDGLVLDNGERPETRQRHVRLRLGVRRLQRPVCFVQTVRAARNAVLAEGPGEHGLLRQFTQAPGHRRGHLRPVDHAILVVQVVDEPFEDILALVLLDQRRTGGGARLRRHSRQNKHLSFEK